MYFVLSAAYSWNVLSTSVFVVFGWQLFIQLWRCSSFYSLHLLFATLFEVVCLLILMLWHWMYSICSFWYALNYFLCAFLSFWALALVGFFLLHRDAVFALSRFFLTVNVSHGTLYFTLNSVGMHSAAASMWVLMKFSYLSFGVSVSDISWRSSNLFLCVIVYSTQEYDANNQNHTL